MRDYCVLRPFNGHQAGDTLRLNDRQAKYLAGAGLIRLRTDPAPPQEQMPIAVAVADPAKAVPQKHKPQSQPKGENNE